MSTVLNILGVLNALPVMLFGLFVFAPFYGIKGLPQRRGWMFVVPCKRVLGLKAGGQTYGCITYAVGNGIERILAGEKIYKHEDTHRVQAFKYGIVFGIAYVIEFLIRLAFDWGEGNDKRRWWRAYYAISWERKARKAAGQRG